MSNAPEKKAKILLPMEKMEQNFTDHLELPNNQRVFFSAEFGAGKSYFLNEYFDKRKEDYYSIHLSPVHYAIHDNMDIFQLLKVDILLHMIQDEKIDFESNEFSNSEVLTSYIENNFSSFFGNVSSIVTSISTNDSVAKIAAISKVLLSIIPSLDGYKSKLIKGTKDLINEELKRITIPDYKVYDFLSEVIDSNLDRLEQKKVLIIDDLDRIDPAQIFRILNVLSVWSNDSHYHTRSQDKNRFGFDHIILVGDINNIKNIFHHVYGNKTDFRGYVRKYYSREIFQFSIQDIAVSFVHYFIDMIEINNLSRISGGLNNTETNGIFYRIIEKLIVSSLSHNKLSVRDFLENGELSFNEKQDKLYVIDFYGDDQRINNNNTILGPIFEIFVSMFSGESSFRYALEYFKDNDQSSFLLFNGGKIDDEIARCIISPVLTIYLLNEFKTMDVRNVTKLYLNEYGIRFSYKFKQSGNRFFALIDGAEKVKRQGVKEFSFYNFLLDGFDLWCELKKPVNFY